MFIEQEIQESDGFFGSELLQYIRGLFTRFLPASHDQIPFSSRRARKDGLRE